jgi:hypothetical protein
VWALTKAPGSDALLASGGGDAVVNIWRDSTATDAAEEEKAMQVATPDMKKLTCICPTCALKGCYLFCSRFQGPLDPISLLKSLAWFIYNEYGNTAAHEHL